MKIKKGKSFVRSILLLVLNRGAYTEKLRRSLFGSYVRLFGLSLFPERIKRNIKEIEIWGRKWQIFDVDTTLSLVEEILIEQEYKPRQKRKDLKIVDLGGNIGLSVLYFKTLFPKARISVFEPDPETFVVLKHNVERAGWRRVELINAAVAEESGEADFYLDTYGGSPLMSLYKERIEKKRIRVKKMRLSDWIKKRKVDLIKMDIEGAEMEVLRDLDKSGFLKSDCDLLIEYHHHLFVDKDRLGEFMQILENNNYGYQLTALLRSPYQEKTVEDIMIWAYKKS